MLKKLNEKMECLFGFCGVLFAGILVVTAAFLTPGYSPVNDTVSSLVLGEARSLFSIGFVVGGALGIPFYIYLEKKLIGINETIRRIATGASIFTCVCIALVGIGYDEKYYDLYLAFHGFVAFVSFFGSILYIGLFSYLMMRDEESIFKKYQSIFGFTIVGIWIVFLVLPYALIEWSLTVFIMVWILLTSLELILR